jgi:hypothetical protein
VLEWPHRGFVSVDSSIGFEFKKLIIFHFSLYRGAYGFINNRHGLTGIT